MKILIYSLLILFLAFLEHFIIWRIHLPARQANTILIIFIVNLVICMIFFWKFPKFEILNILPPDKLIEFIWISLFVITFTLAYMITYSAIEVDSPSLIIIIMIASAGAMGLSRPELFEVLNDDILVKPRLRDLLTDRMAIIEDGKYKLTSKGKIISTVFIIFRNIADFTGEGG